ncbi:MAG: hypothetical protein IPI49_28040 [Myxococcales bacterium]|nr:hypothetical protein [Myxococcales bacterium]
MSASQWFNVVGRAWHAVGRSNSVVERIGWYSGGGTARAHRDAAVERQALVTGGFITSGTTLAPTASVELYDPVTNAWTPASSMGTARTFHTATLLTNGKVLVVGGSNNIDGFLASAELYDPETNAWTPAGTMAESRHGHTATLLGSGMILVVGGFRGPNVELANAELYDPVGNLWTPAGAMAAGRYIHTATLLGSGRVLVTGGGFVSLATAELSIR